MKISGPIALDSLPPLPWKNGGGITRTIAVEPPQAGMSDFLWRISMADVHSSGSFSAFPGIDRKILLWSGNALKLISPSWPDQRLTLAGEPFPFAGEADIYCELEGGPSQDLNLMTRRGAVAGQMKVSTNPVSLHDPCHDLVVLCAEGSLRMHLDESREYTLHASHWMRISQFPGGAILTPIEQKTRFVYLSIQLLHPPA